MSFARHVHYLSAKLRLKPGLEILHIGCGIGSASRELVHFANVEVVGVDTCPSKVGPYILDTEDGHTSHTGQIAYAQTLAENSKLSDRLQFIHGMLQLDASSTRPHSVLT